MVLRRLFLILLIAASASAQQPEPAQRGADGAGRGGRGGGGKGLLVGGVKLPQALAELGLVDEYEFVVHPRLAGHGPTLFAGLSKLST